MLTQKTIIYRFFDRFSGFVADFWRFLEKILDLDLDLRGRRATSGDQISLLCSKNTSLTNAISRFPIPSLGKIPVWFQ